MAVPRTPPSVLPAQTQPNVSKRSAATGRLLVPVGRPRGFQRGTPAGSQRLHSLPASSSHAPALRVHHPSSPQPPVRAPLGTRSAWARVTRPAWPVARGRWSFFLHRRDAPLPGQTRTARGSKRRFLFERADSPPAGSESVLATSERARMLERRSHWTRCGSPGTRRPRARAGAGRGLRILVPPLFPSGLGALGLSDPPVPRCRPGEEGALLRRALHRHGQCLQ